MLASLSACGAHHHLEQYNFSGRTLALAYIVASYRARRWLIPAFHAGVDAGYAGAHDDPKGFSLARWSERLGLWLRRLQPVVNPST